jgi:hypothetical protein
MHIMSARVLDLRQPPPQHFGAIAEAVIGEAASGWGIDRRALPQPRELERNSVFGRNSNSAR